MLETNKTFVFSSATNTNNSTSPTNTINELPTNVMTRPMTTFYYKEEKETYSASYQGQPARLNSAFSHPEEYTYKANSSSSSSNSTTNYTPLLPLSHRYPPPPMKRVKEELPIYAKDTYCSFDTDETDCFFDTHYESDFGDARKVRRRKEMTMKMEKLNYDFLERKERLYSEKVSSIDEELKEAHKDGLGDLESTRQKMIDDGQLFEEYQKRATDHQFELEIYQAEEGYLLETQEIREKLFSVLEEKRRKLKEDKDNYDLAYDVVLDSQSRTNKRNLRKRGTENSDGKINKKKQMNGPALVFKLKEDSINTDMQEIRNISSSV